MQSKNQRKSEAIGYVTTRENYDYEKDGTIPNDENIRNFYAE